MVERKEGRQNEERDEIGVREMCHTLKSVVVTTDIREDMKTIISQGTCHQIA